MSRDECPKRDSVVDSRRLRDSVVIDSEIHPHPLTTLLKELSLAQRPRHFLEKLRFCCQLQNFSDPDVNLPEKELKRVLLLEQLELMNAPARSSCLMVFGVLQGVILMVNANLSRFLEASLFGAAEPQWTEARMNRDEPVSLLAWHGLVHILLC